MACRRWWVATGVMLIALACCCVASRSARAAEGLPHVTLDLKRASLEDVLKVLFRGTPYTFELAPGDYARVTISLEDASWQEALRAVLDMEGLTLAIKGNVYHISGRGASAKAPAPAAPPAAKPVHTMVYLTQFGGRTQLCLREFPYPGYERILWESRPDERISYYFPSPSFDSVLMVTDDRRLLVSVPDRSEEMLLFTALYLLWSGDGDLIVLDFDRWQQKWVEGVYDISLDTLTPTEASSSGLEALEARFADQIRAVTDLVNAGVSLGVTLEAEDVPKAVLRSAGFWMNDVTLTQPRVAVAPDGKHFALTSGKDAVFVVTQTGERSYAVSRTLPPTQLLQDEAVRFEHLRWSPDSKYLTFTETHFYPVQYYPPDLARGYPAPRTITPLVRCYGVEKDDIQTVVVGANAFLAAEGVQFQPGR